MTKEHLFSTRAKNTQKYERILVLLLRFSLGGIFVFSGVAKIIQASLFRDIVSNFEILPEFFIPYFASILPIIELFLGLCLILGLYAKQAAQGLSILLIIFITAISITLMRGLVVNCGCFGGLFGTEIDIQTLAVDFTILGLMVYLSTRNRYIFSIT